MIILIILLLLSRTQKQSKAIALAKKLKDQFTETKIKQKVRIKIRQMSIDIFLNQALQELTSCLFWFVQTKVMMEKDLMPEGIIYQKVLLMETSSSMEKTSMTNPLNNTKRYEEKRNFRTGKGENYTTGCMLDIEYIKNHYILKAVDLSRETL